MGKIGRCPRCDTRIRVPTPQIPDSEPPAAPSSAYTQIQIEATQEVPTEFPSLNRPTSKPGELPQIPISDDPVTAKYLKRSRRKRSFNVTSWIAPLLCGGLLIMIGLIYYLSTLPSYITQATAQRMDPHRSIHVTISPNDYRLDEETFSKIVEEFRERPGIVRSNLVNLTFQADAGGLGVSLSPGPDADLVQVLTLENPDIKEYYINHADELDEARLAEIKRGLISLCNDWANAPEDRKNETLPEYRSTVVYNAFVKGLGRLCHAVVDGNAYPCVHENSKGEFYFLVPTGCESFTIRERGELPEAPFFPSEFKILVSIPTQTAEAVIIEEDPNSESPETQNELSPGDSMNDSELPGEPQTSQ